MSDERKKPSWREIDQRREKGGRSDRRDEPRSTPQSLNAQKSYRAALERAFATGKVGELAKTLTRSTAPTPKPEPTPAPVALSPSPSTPLPPPLAPPAPTPRDPDKDARAKLLAKITTADTRDTITRAINAYLAHHPALPADLDVLTKALSHHDVDLVLATLDHLAALLTEDKPRRTRTLAGQLRLLEDTHDDPAVRRRAAAIRGLL